MKIRFNNSVFFRFISPEAKSFQNKSHIEMISALGEEHQKEILDSIHYAKRIQMAQIPSEKRVKNILERLRKP